MEEKIKSLFQIYVGKKPTKGKCPKSFNCRKTGHFKWICKSFSKIDDKQKNRHDPGYQLRSGNIGDGDKGNHQFFRVKYLKNLKRLSNTLDREKPKKS